MQSPMLEEVCGSQDGCNGFIKDSCMDTSLDTLEPDPSSTNLHDPLPQRTYSQRSWRGKLLNEKREHKFNFGSNQGDHPPKLISTQLWPSPIPDFYEYSPMVVIEEKSYNLKRSFHSSIESTPVKRLKTNYY